MKLFEKLGLVRKKEIEEPKMVSCFYCPNKLDSKQPHYQTTYEGSCYMASVPVCDVCAKKWRKKYWDKVWKVKRCDYDD